jgi:hypothetical protein
VSGSYLGVTAFSDRYWVSAGDTHLIEVCPLTYEEFLQANGVYQEYDEIQTFDFNYMTQRELKIYEKVRELYGVYCKIGGYPEIVKTWVKYNDIEKCSIIMNRLINSFYVESDGYMEKLKKLDDHRSIVNIITKDMLENTLKRLAQDIIARNKDINDIENLNRNDEIPIFREASSDLNEIRLKDRKQALYWVNLCNLINITETYSAIGNPPVMGNNYSYFFMDLGMLSHYYSQLTTVLQSNFDGVLAENFVYLYLYSKLKNNYIESKVCSYKGEYGGKSEEIDFVMHDKNRNRWGFEVKSSSGETKSGDSAFESGRLKYLVKFQETYGSIGERTATIPIFAIDKLKYVAKEFSKI